MNVTKIIKELENKYPGKPIFKNNEKNPTEILCEVEPTSDHSDYSLAIAVIDKSNPHFHNFLTERYKVIRGDLTLHIEGNKIVLKDGDEYTIEPKKIHWAEGNETWIKCHAKPGWTPEDHHLVKEKTT